MPFVLERKSVFVKCRVVVFQFEEQAMLDLDDHTDHRKWTQQHLDAADLRIPSIAPTPPQGEIENDCMDVNVRGPGEYPPSSTRRIGGEFLQVTYCLPST